MFDIFNDFIIEFGLAKGKKNRFQGGTTFNFHKTGWTEGYMNKKCWRV
jgi:hypothetical protein